MPFLIKTFYKGDYTMLSDNLVIVVFGHDLRTRNLYENGKRVKNRNWYYLVWGDPFNNKLGRISKTVLLALQNKAKALIFGTGATWINDQGHVIVHKKYDKLSKAKKQHYISEADYTMEYLFKNFHKLMKFSAIAQEINRFENGADGARKFIQSISIAEDNSNNSQTLIHYSLEICKTLPKTNNICFVSNPSHMERITLLAKHEFKLYKENFSNIFPVWCDTDFAIKNEISIVFEPHSGPNSRPNPFPTDVFKDFQLLSADRQEICLKVFQKIFHEHST